MIGVDTNVLVRYLTQDDPAQARKVDVLVDSAVEEGTRLHVDDIVLCEIAWVLRAAYRLGKADVLEALEKIMSAATFSFDDRDLLRSTLVDYRDGDGDFSDYLIARRNARAGCESTATFDRALRDTASFVVL